MPVLPALVDLHGTPFEAPADFLQVSQHDSLPSSSCLTTCCERAVCAAHQASFRREQGLQWVVTISKKHRLRRFCRMLLCLTLSPKSCSWVSEMYALIKHAAGTFGVM